MAQELVTTPLQTQLPSMTHGLSRLLRSEWSDQGVDLWERPRKVTPEIKGEARQTLSSLRLMHKPAEPDRLAERLKVFLSHWYVNPAVVSGETEANSKRKNAVAGAAYDWTSCCSSYPLAAVNDACHEWLKNNEKRPSIAAFRALCERMDVVGSAIKKLEIIVNKVPVVDDAEKEPVSDDEKRRVAAWMDVWRQKNGLTASELQAFKDGHMPSEVAA